VIALFLCLLPSSAFAVLNGGFTDEDIVKELDSIMQWDGYKDGDNWVGRTGFPSAEGCYGFARDVFDRLYGANIRFSYDKGTTSSSHVYCVATTTDPSELEELLKQAKPGDILCHGGKLRNPHSMIVYNNDIEGGSIQVYDNNWAGPNIVDFRSMTYTYFINHLSTGQSARYSIFRYTAEEAIELEETEKLMMVGEKAELKLVNPPEAFSAPTWVSSNPEIATVDEDGKVKAIHYGNATITCYAGKMTSACEIEVMDIQINRQLLESPPSTFFKTYKYQLDVIIYRANAWPIFNGTVKWESSDPNVAKIDENGVVTIKGEGTAIISATFKYNDLPLIRACTVKVTK